MPSKKSLVYLLVSLSCISLILYAIGLSSSSGDSWMRNRFCSPPSSSSLFSLFCGQPRQASITIVIPPPRPPPTTTTSYQAAAMSTESLAKAVDEVVEVPAGEGGASLFGDTLLSLKETFVKDLKDGKGKGWTVVMGNEAGDLDSLASAVAFSYLSTTLLASPKVISLLQTPRSSLPLRPENTLALGLATLPSNPPATSPFLCIDELPVPADELAQRGVRFALVDHNRLLPAFASGEVAAVIDHHQDDDLYPTADPRIVETGAGSCASLVALYFKTLFPASLTPSSPRTPLPKELATLLLSAIMIDTGGLKEGGKATLKDHSAVKFLFPFSSLQTVNLTSSDASSLEITTEEGIPTPLFDLTQSLLSTKRNVSHLSSADLLARDYKQYLHPIRSTLLPSTPNLRVGLATVPIGLEEWLTRATPSTPWKSLVKSMEAFCAEHKLEVLGVLTSFKALRGKKKHKREILMFLPEWKKSADVPEGGREKVWEALVAGLEGSEALDLKKWKDGEGLVDEVVGWGVGGKGLGRVWRQGNADATRKVTAPVLKEILEGEGGVGDAAE